MAWPQSRSKHRPALGIRGSARIARLLTPAHIRSNLLVKLGEWTAETHTLELYRAIRGVNGLDVVSAGLRRLRACAPTLVIRARTTVHRRNFRFLRDITTKALDLGVNQISFLPADVTSESFNRERSLPL